MSAFLLLFPFTLDYFICCSFHVGIALGVEMLLDTFLFHPSKHSRLDFVVLGYRTAAPFDTQEGLSLIFLF